MQLRRFASHGSGPGWREAFYRCLHHPRLGAELAREAGCSEQVVALIGTADDDAADERRRAALYQAEGLQLRADKIFDQVTKIDPSYEIPQLPA